MEGTNTNLFKIRRRPRIIIEEDGSEIILKALVNVLRVRDEFGKSYLITRTPIKKGLQMTGA
jgi:hypothetical protein